MIGGEGHRPCRGQDPDGCKHAAIVDLLNAGEGDRIPRQDRVAPVPVIEHRRRVGHAEKLGVVDMNAVDGLAIEGLVSREEV